MSVGIEIEDSALLIIKSEDGGVLQSDLWKMLGIDSRKCSRMLCKLVNDGQIVRKWETVKGTRTYRLFRNQECLRRELQEIRWEPERQQSEIERWETKWRQEQQRIKELQEIRWEPERQQSEIERWEIALKLEQLQNEKRLEKLRLSCCDTLKRHYNELHDDPERLRTDFILKMINEDPEERGVKRRVS